MPQSGDAAKLIDQGLAAHGAGDIAGAHAKFAEAVDLAPDDPEALHLLGLTHEMHSDRDQAIALIERAVAIDPREPIFRMNLAAILEKNRRFDEAAGHLDAALEIKPDATDIWTLRGDVELSRNAADDAAGAYRRAYELDGHNIDALAGYGRAQLLKGDVAEANRAAAAALKASLSSEKSLTLALHIAKHQRDGRTINRVAQVWRNAHKANRDSLGTLAELLFEFGYWKEARHALAEVVWQEPVDTKLLISYGRYCTTAREFTEAGEVLEKALALDPDSAMALYAMSRLKFYTGDLEAAEALSARAIAANPRLFPAFTQLCDLRKGKMLDDDLAAMRELASNERTPPDEAYKLLLALGNVYHARSQAEDAIVMLHEGNKTGARVFHESGDGFDCAQCKALTEKLLSLFASPPQRHDFEPAPAIPIFVVGMPRSGTTLMESVLAAHPDILGAGELTRLPTILRDILAWAEQKGAATINDAPKEQLQTWRDLYFASFPNLDGARYVVDKQPLNFRCVGLILALFPKAKIVHIRRNPMETGFSIYRHPFNREWSFACRLEDIAYFYGDYARLIAHWEKLYPADFPLFQYETLIADFESEARRLYDHCGLNWRDEFLDFHKIKRPIVTFSAVQARQPLQTKPESAALRYAEYLTPLSHGLATANIDLKTGAMRHKSP